jgi:hypothetical protein
LSIRTLAAQRATHTQGLLAAAGYPLQVGTSGAAQARLPINAFDGTTYAGYNRTTGGSGQAIFTLPLASFTSSPT